MKQDKDLLPQEHQLIKQLNRLLVSELGLSHPTDLRQSGLVAQERAVNLLLADPEAGIVVRVREAAQKSSADIQTNLDLINQAISHGAPILAPLKNKPIIVKTEQADYTATIWPLADNRLITAGELAQVLRGIHDTPPPANTPAWLEVRHGDMRHRLERLGQLKYRLKTQTISKCYQLVENSLADLERFLPKSPKRLLHGDGHPANVVIFEGKPIAIDLDDISLGPIEADLSLPFVHAARYIGANEDGGDRLAAAYGRDYDADLLGAIIKARAINKLLNVPEEKLDDSEAVGMIEQRLDVIENGGKFKSLWGAETVCLFDTKKYRSPVRANL